MKQFFVKNSIEIIFSSMFAVLFSILAFSMYMGNRTDGEYVIPSSSIDRVLACYPFRSGFNTFALTVDGDTVQFISGGQYDSFSLRTNKFLLDSIVVAPVRLHINNDKHTNHYSFDKDFDVYSWR